MFHFPDEVVQAAAFRSFDPVAKTWAIWGRDGRAGQGSVRRASGNFLHYSGGFAACDLTQITLSINNGPQRRLGWSSAFEMTRELLASPHAARAQGGRDAPAL